MLIGKFQFSSKRKNSRAEELERWGGILIFTLLLYFIKENSRKF
jgi:hypothetical protein